MVFFNGGVTRPKLLPLFLVLSCFLVGVAQARPGFIYALPAASQQTTVLRDVLGNQATAYAYQDGHSSSVALSRRDVSKHLTYVPAAVPVQVAVPVVQSPALAVYEQPAIAGYGGYGHLNHYQPAAYSYYGGYGAYGGSPHYLR